MGWDVTSSLTPLAPEESKKPRGSSLSGTGCASLCAGAGANTFATDIKSELGATNACAWLGDLDSLARQLHLGFPYFDELFPTSSHLGTSYV